MRTYNKEFKEEAVKLSDEVGVHQAAEQLGITYYTLACWRQKRKAYRDQAYTASEISQGEPFNERKRQMMKKISELKKPMRFSRTPSVFSQKTGRSRSKPVV